MKRMSYRVFLFAFALAWISLRAQSAPLQLYSASHPAMGTTYVLYLYASSQAEADADTAPVFEEIDRLDDLLSNYKTTSELSRINREAADAPVTTDPETFGFLQTSLAWGARSNGAFDITVGSLMKAWGFFKAQGHLPSDAELAPVRAQTGWQRVQLDTARRTVRFLSPGIQLDPGGIGKGYAVEKAIAILHSEHVSAALLSAGSSTIYALGAPPGEQGWKVTIPSPGDATATLSTITLRDTSLSTANCSEKHFINNGHLYCHIMDPHRLRPVEGMLQVTVTDPSATDSDALSNVLFVQGADAAPAALRSLPHDSALVVSAKRECTTIRWNAAIAPGHCNQITPAKEN